MKKLVFVLLVTVGSTASAWQNNYGYNSGYGNNNSGYVGSSGTRYQYDLSNPGDQIRYDIDVGAQLRDDISVNVGRDIDRGIGQYGGGIYND